MNIKLFLFSLILVNFSNVFCQDRTENDTVYYRFDFGFLNKCEKDKAVGFRLTTPMNNDLYLEKIYYLQSENTMAEYFTYDKVFKNGNFHSTVDVKSGKYLEYFLNGQLRVETNYTENKIDGEFKVFYENGQLKRIEDWKNGDWISGKCFDELGNQTAYCSYQEKAEFIGGQSEMFKYISENLNYPNSSRRKGYEGKVFVKFTIDIDGFIKDVLIVKGVEENIDKEAKRLIEKMPKWKPSKFEGQNIQSEFVLPLNFKLD